MNDEMTCIVCPRGCEMRIVDGHPAQVIGAGCKRGVKYALNELRCPVRTIASSALVDNGTLPLVSVRVTAPIPKDKIFDVMKVIKKIKLSAPCHVGVVGDDAVVGGAPVMN